MAELKLEDLPRYTYDTYRQWQDNWELLYGIAYAMSPAPSIKHQSISNKIAWQLHKFLKECEQCQALMPVDWKISDETVVQADNSVICHTPANDAYIIKDKELKYHLYENEGVSYYIIVDPAELIAKVYQLKEGRYIKLADATDETVEFSLHECENSIKFDFKKIW